MAGSPTTMAAVERRRRWRAALDAGAPAPAPERPEPRRLDDGRLEIRRPFEVAWAKQVRAVRATGGGQRVITGRLLPRRSAVALRAGDVVVTLWRSTDPWRRHVPHEQLQVWIVTPAGLVPAGDDDQRVLEGATLPGGAEAVERLLRTPPQRRVLEALTAWVDGLARHLDHCRGFADGRDDPIFAAELGEREAALRRTMERASAALAEAEATLP